MIIKADEEGIKAISDLVNYALLYKGSAALGEVDAIRRTLKPITNDKDTPSVKEPKEK